MELFDGTQPAKLVDCNPIEPAAEVVCSERCVESRLEGSMAARDKAGGRCGRQFRECKRNRRVDSNVGGDFRGLSTLSPRASPWVSDHQHNEELRQDEARKGAYRKGMGRRNGEQEGHLC